MNFQDKLQEFKHGGIRSVEEVKASQLADIGISNFRNLNNIHFEIGISLGSESVTPPGGIFIGAHSYMGNAGILRNGVMIGRYCSIGRRVTLGAATHPIYAVSTYPPLCRGRGNPYTEEQKTSLGISINEKPAHTIIGHDVWIGDGAVIMSGVTVGTGAIIGANAVVTHDVPPYAIAVGVSAKIIRHRFPEKVAEDLVASKYWELPFDFLKTKPLNNVFEFLDECSKEVGSPNSVPYKTYKLISG